MRTEDRMRTAERLPRPCRVRPSWRAVSTAAIVAAAAGQLGATDCGGGITRDPGFDLWCGDALCAWKVERGEVRRVPTWHEADAGVELIDPGTAIEQFTPVNSGDGTCVRFDLISNVDETAQAELAVDIYGGGPAAAPGGGWGGGGGGGGGVRPGRVAPPGGAGRGGGGPRRRAGPRPGAVGGGGGPPPRPAGRAGRPGRRRGGGGGGGPGPP